MNGSKAGKAQCDVKNNETGEEQLEKLQKTVSQIDISYIQTAKKSIGIANTVLRLRQYYQDKVQIEISSEIDEGTEICIRMPNHRE